MANKEELPSGLTPAAQRSRDRFLRMHAEAVKRIKKIPLDVLVWGPSPTSKSPVAKKRTEIRSSLIKRGFNAMFSEDITGSPELPENTREFEQARLAHVIIVLPEDSPGAIAELHDFCLHPELGPKILALVPRRYSEGYSARGAIRLLDEAWGGVKWYEDGDLQACKVLKLAITRAEARRIVYVRNKT